MRYNKLFLIVLSIMLLTICLPSCNKKESPKANDIGKVAKDTLWNDNIQGEFFGTKFGASKAELIKNFRNHGLILNTYASTDALLHFSSSKGKFKTFGGMNWEIIDVNLNNNGKFVRISFMNASDDKASALQTYNDILSTVSHKYQFMDIETTDTTMYAAAVAFSKLERVAAISCFRYETINHQIKIGTILEYVDYSFENEVSDEL